MSRRCWFFVALSLVVASALAARVLYGHFSPTFELAIELEYASTIPADDRVEVFLNNDPTAPLVAPVPSAARRLTFVFENIPDTIRQIRVDPTRHAGVSFTLHSAMITTRSLSWLGEPRTIYRFELNPGKSFVRSNLRSEEGRVVSTTDDSAFFFFPSPELDLFKLEQGSPAFFSGVTVAGLLIVLSAVLTFIFLMLSPALETALVMVAARMRASSPRALYCAATSFAVTAGVASALIATATLSPAFVRSRFGLYSERDLARQRTRLGLFEYITPAEASVDVRSIAGVRSKDDLRKARTRLWDAIWHGSRSFERMPDSVVAVPPVIRSDALRSTDELRIEMDYGITSTAYLLRAARPASCLMMYHGGHEAAREDVFSSVEPLLDRLLGQGCDVLLFSMPLFGANPSEAKATLEDGSEILIRQHDDFMKLERKDFSALKFFVELVLRGLSYALREGGHYGFVGMAGLSGGGWTTIVVGALDDRVQHIYPVAGMLPSYLVSDRSQCGPLDFEQVYLEEVAGIDTFSLYLLGASTPAETSLIMFNKYDPACLPGIKVEAFRAQLAGLANELDVHSLEFWIDEENEQHSISPRAQERILDDTRSLRADNDARVLQPS